MNPRFSNPRPPVLLDEAFPDPALIDSLVAANAPYWPVLRYVAKPEEFAAVSRAKSRDPITIPPWFRGDWADQNPLVPGAEAILGNPRFVKAAKQLFDAEVVCPCLVYVNLMAPLPFSGEGHIDVPAFRGIDRANYPIWLLQQMTRSGLFLDWQIDVATAVSWFYTGEGGAFDYWAKGPSELPDQIAHPLNNRAVVGDNDFMFHRVASIGRDARMVEGSLDAELRPDTEDGQGWVVEDGGRILARYPNEAIRVSVSWKAEVYKDEAARRVRFEHEDDLDLDRVIDAFLEDLARRGVSVARPSDPLNDPKFIDTLAGTYTLPDLVYPAA